jgi:hypothetical protein
MGGVDESWIAILMNGDGNHHIQPQEGKIRQIFLGQRFSLKVGMDEPKSSQS